MKLITDIKIIEKLSEKNHDENWDFRSFLKSYDASIEEIDAMVQELHDWISSEIDCTACANCCRKCRIGLNNKDIRRFAKGLSIPLNQFKASYLLPDDEAPEHFVFKRTPCPFLKDNVCVHYDFRPTDCRSFPHLHKKEFVFRLWDVVENCSICPIVFNVYEHLKEELWHPDYDDFLDDVDF